MPEPVNFPKSALLHLPINDETDNNVVANGHDLPSLYSGRRQYSSRLTPSTQSLAAKMNQLLALLVFLASAIFRIAEACSSRSTPKPRPPSQSTRPNITFPTFECPREYQNYFCLNGARCFTVKIENNILYNCECADGFTGSRCEFKDLDGSYLPSREKVNIETASIAGGVTLAVVLAVIIIIACYARRRKKNKKHEEVYRPFGAPKPAYTLQNLPSTRSHDSDLEAGDSSNKSCLPNPSADLPATSSRNRMGAP